MRRGDLVETVEASYAVRLGNYAWLSGLHDALAPFVEAGLGTCACSYELGASGIQVLDAISVNGPVDADTLKRLVTSTTSDYVDKSWRLLPCAMASEVPGYDDQPCTTLTPLGIRDVLAINAYDPSGRGVWVAAFHPQRRPLKSRVRTRLTRISAHVAAGLRLRDRLKRRDSVAEAVLTPDGRVLHAEGDARISSARDALTNATRDIELARGAMRRSDPDGALVRWRALVSARWTLIDDFQQDGKHYLIAQSNASRAPTILDLAARERQVLTYAALGHHNKLIAYELGIAWSTVRVLLARASRKLGAKTRDETIHAFEKLLRQETSAAPDSGSRGPQ